MRCFICILVVVGLVLSMSSMVMAQTVVRPHQLDWTPPAQGSVPDGYMVYRSTDHGASWAPLTPTRITALTLVDSALVIGQEYCYRGTATFGGQESLPTPGVCVVAKAQLLPMGNFRCNITLSDCVPLP